MKTQLNIESDIYFTGLSRTLSKNVFTHNSITRLNSCYPKSNGIVGNLPYQFIKNIPLQGRSETIKAFYEEFGKAISLNKNSEIEILKENLERILKKYRLIKNSSNVDIQKCGQGNIAIGYKLNIPEENIRLFLKLFTNEDFNFLSYGHGVQNENNLKIFLSKKLVKKSESGHFSKFYFGDINNKYYIEEFLDEKRSTSALTPPFYKLKELKTTVQNILKRFGLYHFDLKEYNFKIYQNHNKEPYLVCFDLGGIVKIKK